MIEVIAIDNRDRDIQVTKEREGTECSGLSSRLAQQAISPDPTSQVDLTSQKRFIKPGHFLLTCHLTYL